MNTSSTTVLQVTDGSTVIGGRSGVNSTLAEPLRYGAAAAAPSTVLAASAGASARSADLISPAQVTPLHWTVATTEADRRREERKRREALDRSKVRSGLYPVDQVVDIARKGLGRGYRQTGATRGEWDISGTCENRRPVTLDGAAARLAGGRYVRAQGGRPLTVILYTRCRKCPPCLGRRRNLWAARARDEVALSTRTWFATLTLAPAAHWMLECRASARLTESGVDLRKLPAAERFAEVVKEYAEELTRFMKRVRKNSGARLRYLLVAEPHKSGRPHFHALIHELGTDVPIRHAVLRSAWNLGFTKFKLVERDVKACWYVAKYLSKTVAARVRASLGYGRGGDRINTRGTSIVGLDEGPTWPNRPSSSAPKTERSLTKSTEKQVFPNQINEIDNGYQDDLYNDLRRNREARYSASGGRPLGPWAAAGLQSPARQAEAPSDPEAPSRARAASQTLRSLQTLGTPALIAPSGWRPVGAGYRAR